MSDQTSKTPETDAMMVSGKAHYMSLDLARSLELRLREQTERVKKLEKAIVNARGYIELSEQGIPVHDGGVLAEIAAVLSDHPKEPKC